MFRLTFICNSQMPISLPYFSEMWMQTSLAVVPAVKRCVMVIRLLPPAFRRMGRILLSQVSVLTLIWEAGGYLPWTGAGTYIGKGYLLWRIRTLGSSGYLTLMGVPTLDTVCTIGYPHPEIGVSPSGWMGRAVCLFLVTICFIGLAFIRSLCSTHLQRSFRLLCGLVFLVSLQAMRDPNAQLTPEQKIGIIVHLRLSWKSSHSTSFLIGTGVRDWNIRFFVCLVKSLVKQYCVESNFQINRFK